MDGMIFLDDMQYLWHPVGCLNALFKYTGSWPFCVCVEWGRQLCVMLCCGLNVALLSAAKEEEIGTGAGFHFTPTQDLLHY